MRQDRSRDEKKLAEKIKPQHDYREDERSALDQFVDQQFVDDIPLIDLKIGQEQEKDKHKQQNTSQTEEKYDADFGDNNR